MKTIIIGLGNPILGDDGVGWRGIEEISQHYQEKHPLASKYLWGGWAGIDGTCMGYDRAIIMNSFMVDEEDVGSILIRKLNDLPNYSAFHITSAYDTSLQNAIHLGREMGACLPVEVVVIGVAIQHITEFGKGGLSPSVAETVLPTAHIALNEIKEKINI